MKNEEVRDLTTEFENYFRHSERMMFTLASFILALTSLVVIILDLPSSDLNRLADITVFSSVIMVFFYVLLFLTILKFSFFVKKFEFVIYNILQPKNSKRNHLLMKKPLEDFRYLVIFIAIVAPVLIVIAIAQYNLLFAVFISSLLVSAIIEAYFKIDEDIYSFFLYGDIFKVMLYLLFISILVIPIDMPRGESIIYSILLSLFLFIFALLVRFFRIYNLAKESLFFLSNIENDKYTPPVTSKKLKKAKENLQEIRFRGII